MLQNLTITNIATDTDVKTTNYFPEIYKLNQDIFDHFKNAFILVTVILFHFSLGDDY